jgi:hypothetical protein
MVSLRNAINTTADVSVLQLADFRLHAEGGAAVAVVRERTTIRVTAVGMIPDDRSIAWLRSSEDTAAHFVSSLGNAFGKRIAEHIARELKLLSRGSVPLTSSLVRHAIRMAESAKAALEGVAFMDALRTR